MKINDKTNSQSNRKQKKLLIWNLNILQDPWNLIVDLKVQTTDLRT